MTITPRVPACVPFSRLAYLLLLVGSGFVFQGYWNACLASSTTSATLTADRVEATFEVRSFQGADVLVVSEIKDLVTQHVYDVSFSPLWQLVFRSYDPVYPEVSSSNCDPDDPNAGPDPKPVGFEEFRYPASSYYANPNFPSMQTGGYPNDYPRAASVCITSDPNTVTLNWNGFSVKCPGVGRVKFDVEMTVASEKVIGDEKLLTWSIKVPTLTKSLCNGIEWMIYEVRSPLFFLPPIGSTGSDLERRDDYLLFPFAHGSLIQNPIGHRNFYVDMPEVAVFNDGDNRGEKFLYPGRVQAQFLAYYDDEISNPSDPNDRKSGLFLAANDPAGFAKKLYYGSVVGQTQGDPDPDKLRYLFTYFTHYKEGLVDADFQSFDQSALRAMTPTGYKVVLDAFCGDWWDAAQRYRSLLLEWEADADMDGEKGPFEMGTLEERVMAEADFAKAVEVHNNLVYNAFGTATPICEDTGSPAVSCHVEDELSDFSRIRAWSEYFSSAGGGGSGDPCINLLMGFGGSEEVLPPNPTLPVESLCNDVFAHGQLSAGASQIIRLMRDTVTVQESPLLTTGPLFEWSMGRTDAGNFGGAIAEQLNNQALEEEFKEKGLPTRWNGRFLVRNKCHMNGRYLGAWCDDHDIDSVIAGGYTCSGSTDVLTKRLINFKTFLAATNDPNTSSTCTIDSGTCDWKGQNGLILTGAAGRTRLCYEPRHNLSESPGPEPNHHGHPGVGGTYWLDGYEEFINTFKDEVADATLESDHRQFPVFTERANEQLIPYAFFNGKYRAEPADKTYDDDLSWLPSWEDANDPNTSAMTFTVPLASALYHEHTVVAAGVPRRSNTVAEYGPAMVDENSTAEDLQSHRYRLRMATSALDGALLGFSMLNPNNSFVVELDGPPDADFPETTMDPNWVYGPVKDDYVYARDLTNLRAHYDEFLIYGQMMRRPEICFTAKQGCGVLQDVLFKRPVQPDNNIDIKRVYGTTWKDSQNRIAIFLTNFDYVTNPPCFAQFSFVLKTKGLGLDEDTCYKVRLLTQDCTTSTVGAAMTSKLKSCDPEYTSDVISLLPGESRVYILEVDSPCSCP